jgi:hypothetical protein
MQGEHLSTSDVFEMAAEKRLLIIVGKGQMFSHTTSDEAMDVEPDARVTGEGNRRPVKEMPTESALPCVNLPPSLILASSPPSMLETWSFNRACSIGKYVSKCYATC